MRFNRFWQYRDVLLSRRFVPSLWRARRNMIEDQRGRSPASGPYMAELDVTYRCNCRCEMCRRWEDPREGELTFCEYEKLAETLRQMGTHLVSIAGGEPLLRKDIFEIIRVFAERGMFVNLCTNGLLLEKHADRLSHSGASCVTVSLDGAEAGTHDKIRGLPGSYDRIEEGIRYLISRPRRQRPMVRVRMTISNQNLGEIRPYWCRWKRIVDDVLFQPSHYCQDAFYSGKEEEAFRLDAARLSNHMDGTSLGRNGYMKSLMRGLLINGTFPEHRCYAGVLMARLDPWGNVFPCLEQHVRLGSVREHDFRTIWNSGPFNHYREEIARNKNCRCWYNNTALISHYAMILGLITISPFNAIPNPFSLARHIRFPFPFLLLPKNNDELPKGI